MTREPLADGHMIDVSLSGAYLAIDYPFRAECRVEVRVDETSDPEQSLPTLQTVIIRYDGCGVGVEWASLGTGAVAIILDLAAPQGRWTLDYPTLLRPKSAYPSHRGAARTSSGFRKMEYSWT